MSTRLPLAVKGDVIKHVYRIKLSTSLSSKLKHTHGKVTVKHRIRQHVDVDGDGRSDRSQAHWSSFRVVVPHKGPMTPEVRIESALS